MKWVLTVLILCASIASAHDSPIDHVDRTVQIYAVNGLLHVVYRFRCEERQALLQLNEMDTNRDGKISEGERSAYFVRVATRLSEQLHVEVEGKELRLASEGAVQLGADLSQTYHLSAPLGAMAIGSHAGKFRDEFSRTSPGGYRWSPRQTPAPDIDVEATEAPGLEPLGPHPAMIVVNLRIVVRAAGKP